MKKITLIQISLRRKYEEANGKQYNCDLSASYNIGARYFINAILQCSTVKKRSELEAKVPEVLVRTNCVLSTLISLAKAM